MQGFSGYSAMVNLRDSAGNEITSLGGGAAIQAGHSRFIAGITSTTIKSVTWTDADGVTEVRFKVKNNANGAPGDVLRAVPDASPVADITDTTQAANWLAIATSSPTTDVEYYELTLGGILLNAAGTDNVGYINEWSDWFSFDTALRRLDFIAETASRTYNVLVEVR
jgi:hypothetical protein